MCVWGYVCVYTDKHVCINAFVLCVKPLINLGAGLAFVYVFMYVYTKPYINLGARYVLLMCC